MVPKSTLRGSVQPIDILIAIPAAKEVGRLTTWHLGGNLEEGLWPLVWSVVSTIGDGQDDWKRIQSD
jgi:hypothetical protein